ncbi:hypothetical protein [Sediminicola luteus]|uniref:PKD/Chitinase domain-containing protein n=1 Tax=Sediminicola luteus TaxID=319238 RepID=A0ABV2TSE0_9FLAO
MKHIKKLLVLFLVINVFNSCTEEEVSYALEDISAPTNVKAIFNVSQDDTGTVTITPTAEGASTFEIYFGDVENETPTTASPGEMVSHVYGEGEFSLRVVAIGMTGLKSELVRIVTISFSAPTDLDFTAEISNTDPFEVSVTPTATNATVYDVYFGDVENEEPTTIMDSESAVHVYAEVGDYDVRVVARGAGAATIELTKTVTISGASNAVSLPITFDDATVNYAFGTFNGTSFEVVDNPDLSGANAVASMVGAITNSGSQWEGGAFNLGTPVDFAGDNKTITMKLWSDVTVPVLLKFEGGVNGERQNEVVVTHGGTGWEDLSFDFATNAIKSYIDGTQGVGEPFVPTGQYATLVMFIDGPGTTAGTFYWDDIAQEAAAAAGKPEIPIDMESASLDYTWNGFGSVDFGPIPAAVINNPDKSGINTSNKVLEIQKQSGAQVWAGASLDLAGPVDFANGTTIKMKVWSPRIGTKILFKMEDSTSPPDGNGNPTTVVEVITSSTVAMAWEELTFDLTTFGAFSSSNSYDRVIIFPDFDNGGQGEDFYFDDIIQTNGSGGGSSSGKVSFPVDFETPGTGAAATWIVFEADTAPLEIVSNPNASGLNTSNTVAKLTATPTNAPYAGTITSLETPFVLSTSNSVVKMMVFKDKIGPVGVKLAKGEGTVDEIKVNNTKIGEWEELTFDFTSKIGSPEANGIDALVVFPDFENRTSTSVTYFDNITLNASTGGGGGGSSRAEIPTLDFEGAESMDGAFDAGATGATVSNPVSGGINTSANVYAFNKVANSAWYSGTFKIYGQDIELATKKTFSLKVYSPKAGINVRFQLEKEGVGGSGFSVDQTVSTANEWVTLTYDFSSINAANAYDKIVVFLDFDDVAQAPGDGTIYYIDDITQQ